MVNLESNLYLDVDLDSGRAKRTGDDAGACHYELQDQGQERPRQTLLRSLCQALGEHVRHHQEAEQNRRRRNYPESHPEVRLTGDTGT
jgi:hypothetical protein